MIAHWPFRSPFSGCNPVLLKGLIPPNERVESITAISLFARVSSKPENLSFPPSANFRVALFAHDRIMYV